MLIASDSYSLNFHMPIKECFSIKRCHIWSLNISFHLAEEPFIETIDFSVIQ